MLRFRLSTFFTAIRPFFGGTLNQDQVVNMEALLMAAAPRVTGLGETGHQQVAYILATVRHEVGPNMKPIEEHGRGAGHDYGRFLDIGTGPGNRVPYTTPALLYFGRGHVQLTWRSNYLKMGRLLGVDLLNQPELMLTAAVSARAAVEGMVRGSFTSKKLADYFKAYQVPDPINARRIINGVRKGEKLPDKAELIETYYEQFLKALKLSAAAADKLLDDLANTPPAPTK